MVTGHFLVQLTDGSVQGSVSVLLVHVVNSGSGLILKNNAECLDMVGSAFVNLVN